MAKRKRTNNDLQNIHIKLNQLFIFIYFTFKAYNILIVIPAPCVLLVYGLQDNICNIN